MTFGAIESQFDEIIWRGKTRFLRTLIITYNMNLTCWNYSHSTYASHLSYPATLKLTQTTWKYHPVDFVAHRRRNILKTAVMTCPVVADNFI